MEDDAIIILLPEPHDIDGLLEYRVPVRVMRTPTNVRFLYTYVAQCIAEDNTMGRTRYIKVMSVTRSCASLTLRLMLSGVRLVSNPNKNSTVGIILFFISMRNFILLSTN
jgi:hypothetical protein